MARLVLVGFFVHDDFKGSSNFEPQVYLIGSIVMALVYGTSVHGLPLNISEINLGGSQIGKKPILGYIYVFAPLHSVIRIF